VPFRLRAFLTKGEKKKKKTILFHNHASAPLGRGGRHKTIRVSFWFLKNIRVSNHIVVCHQQNPFARMNNCDQQCYMHSTTAFTKARFI
jgi:hypothetical protein